MSRIARATDGWCSTRLGGTVGFFRNAVIAFLSFSKPSSREATIPTTGQPSFAESVSRLISILCWRAMSSMLTTTSTGRRISINCAVR